MKKKIFIAVVLIFALSLALIGCNKNAPSNMDNDYGGEISSDQRVEDIGELLPPERMIIYTVNADLYTDNFNQTLTAIKGSLKSDEWLDSDSLTNGRYAFLTVRVKSSRLDSFLAGIYMQGEVKNFDKTAEDISLAYQNLTGRIASLEAERTRLNELMEKASMADLIVINSRLSEVERQLFNLKGQQNKFDSLHEYSTVYLRIYDTSAVSKPAFSKRISTAFKGGWQGLSTFFQWSAIVIVAVFPFAVVFVPLGVLIFFLVKLIKKRKSNKSINSEKKE